MIYPYDVHELPLNTEVTVKLIKLILQERIDICHDAIIKFQKAGNYQSNLEAFNSCKMVYNELLQTIQYLESKYIDKPS